MRFNFFVCGVACAVLALGGAARGQIEDGDALRGPSVKQPAATKTIVRRDMSGKLEALDTRPEQAALGVIGLRSEERAAADKLLAQRYAKVTRLLEENWDLFIRIQTARQGGAKPEEIRPLMREFRPIAESMLSPTVAEQVSEALPEDKRVEFKKIIDEYRTAFLAEDRGGTGAGAGRTGGGGGRGRGRTAAGGDEAGKPAGGSGAAGAPARYEMNLLLREMARSLKGIVDERKEHMEAFLKAIDATPEQEAKIREVTRAAAEASRRNGAIGEPSPQARAATYQKIMDLLTPEQRQKAMAARRAGG